MRRLVPAVLLVCALGLLAACQPTLGGKKPTDVTPNAVTGGAIETTALDAPPGEAEVAKDPLPDAKTAGPEKAAAQSADAAAPPVAEGADAAAKGDPAAAAAPAGATPEPAPTPELAETPVTPKSDAQLACEKKRGKWSKVGKGELRACIFQTRDSGKSCTRESDCEGVCLARSGTCSPYKPLYGCNDILQDDGQRVTLCLD